MLGSHMDPPGLQDARGPLFYPQKLVSPGQQQDEELYVRPGYSVA